MSRPDRGSGGCAPRLFLNERPVALVADLSRAWGVLPTADAGRTVWAVFDAHPDQSAPKAAI